MPKNLLETQLVLVSGPPRAGLNLIASQLARHPRSRLLESSGIALNWLEKAVAESSFGDDLEDQLIRPDSEGAGGEANDGFTHIIVVCPQLLIDPGLPNRLANSDLATRCHVVIVERYQADGICSLARFPHLQPHLPDPWRDRLKFLTAATALWELARKQSREISKLGLPVKQIWYERFVNAPESTLREVWEYLELPLITDGAKPNSLPGISPSLCFRERPVDSSAVGRFLRQLSPTEVKMISPSEIRWELESTPAASSTPPLIATGRGGSGTRLLSEVLLAQGVHLGDQLNPTGDSVQWADILYEMALAKLNGHDQPWSGTWKTELKHRADWLYGSVSPSQPWGFKLPEAMLVCEQLLKYWPGARMIHLVRHPLDTCLRRTHMTSRTSNPIGLATLRTAYHSLGLAQDPELEESYRRNAVSWWYQLDLIQRQKALYPDRVFELRYEDLCDSPQKTADELADSLGLTRKLVSLDVDGKRRRHWEHGDSRIAEVWGICGPIAESYGYKIDD